MSDVLFIRIFFVVLIAWSAYYLKPFQLDAPIAAAAGAVLGAATVLFEMRLERVSLKRLIGAAIGSVLGILGFII